MSSRNKTWNYVTVTGIAVIIWFWAAGATRESNPVFAQLEFAPGDASANWIVDPPRHAVKLTIEGSNWALQKAEAVLRDTLNVPIAPRSGAITVDLLRELKANQSLRDTGVSVTACEPATFDLMVDRKERFTLPVRVSLGGVQTTGEVQVEPAEAAVFMPGSARALLPQQATLLAAVGPEQVRDLTPGSPHALTVPITLPNSDGIEGLVIEPTNARVSFTLRARTAQVTLETVRLQVAGPRQDFDDYVISFDDTLGDVTVTGDIDLIRRIGAGEVRVIALLHLTSNDKERAISRKRICGFIALDADGTMSPIEGRVAGKPELPEIDMQIKPRAAAMPPDAVDDAHDSAPTGDGVSP